MLAYFLFALFISTMIVFPFFPDTTGVKYEKLTQEFNKAHQVALDYAVRNSCVLPAGDYTTNDNGDTIIEQNIIMDNFFRKTTAGTASAFTQTFLKSQSTTFTNGSDVYVATYMELPDNMTVGKFVSTLRTSYKKKYIGGMDATSLFLYRNGNLTNADGATVTNAAFLQVWANTQNFGDVPIYINKC